MSEIQPGAVVRLKSGSASMTVETVRDGFAVVVGIVQHSFERWEVAVVALQPYCPPQAMNARILG